MEVAKIRQSEEGAVAMKTLCQICGIDVREISSKKSEERIERQRKSFMKDFDSKERLAFYPSEAIIKEVVEFQTGDEMFHLFEYENYFLIPNYFKELLAFSERDFQKELPSKALQLISKSAKNRAEKLSRMMLVQNWIKLVIQPAHKDIKEFYQALATCLKIQYNR